MASSKMIEYTISDGDKIEKYHVAILLDKSETDTPEWIQLAKATENTISVNPETEDREFITDKAPTTLIKRYKPSMNNPLTLFKGEADYEFLFDKFYNLPTGSDANGKVCIVFMNEADSSNTYKAWLSDVTFVFDNLDPANSQLTCNLQFNGTITLGTVKCTSGVPVFTPAA